MAVGPLELLGPALRHIAWGNEVSSVVEPSLDSAPRPRAGRSLKLMWLLPVVALILIGVSAWKLNRPPQSAMSELADPTAIRMAPLFELRDPQGSLVRLSTYLGREKIVVVFFQAARHFDDSPVLSELSHGFDSLYSQRPKILAIGTQQAGVYRRWIENDGPEPFLILSDLLEPHVSQRWGAQDTKTSEPIEAVFLIDRAGWIRKSYLGPDHLGTAKDWARDLANFR